VWLNLDQRWRPGKERELQSTLSVSGKQSKIGNSCELAHRADPVGKIVSDMGGFRFRLDRALSIVINQWSHVWSPSPYQRESPGESGPAPKGRLAGCRFNLFISDNECRIIAPPAGGAYPPEGLS
jgi:hypothetical protein